jgi:hypothetical protein
VPREVGGFRSLDASTLNWVRFARNGDEEPLPVGRRCRSHCVAPLPATARSRKRSAREARNATAANP